MIVSREKGLGWRKERRKERKEGRKKETRDRFSGKKAGDGKEVDPPVGTRLESDPLYISFPWKRGRRWWNRGEGGGSSRERIVERGHRVRRDDPLSSLRLLNRIVNTPVLQRGSLLPATCAAARASLCPPSFTRPPLLEILENGAVNRQKKNKPVNDPE